jgi:hypothetical protein
LGFGTAVAQRPPSEVIAMYQDIITLFLLIIVGPFCAIAALRFFWKTKRTRRPVKNFR